MKGHLLTDASALAPASSAAVTDLLAAGTFFWLDIESLDQEAMDLLSGPFKFHPLAVEDVEHFGQRPKIDEYDGYMFIVAYGAEASGGSATVPGLVEVHCFDASTFLVTIHRSPCSDLQQIAQRLADRRGAATTPLLSCTGSSTLWWTASSRSFRPWTTGSTRRRTGSSPNRRMTSWGPCST